MSETSKRIPPELLAHIEEEDRRIFRRVVKVASDLREMLKPLAVHAVHIIPQRGRIFDAYIFFTTDSDLRRAEGDGTTQTIADTVYDALERAGLGGSKEIQVRFQFDSDEHVKTIPGGYFMRLR